MPPKKNNMKKKKLGGMRPKNKVIRNMNEKVFTSNNPTEIFENIYKHNYWQFGSGRGSLVENNREYIDFLPRKLQELGVKTVVDIGCGDWQFSRYIDWTPFDYLGVDIVGSVIEENKRNFEKENIKFDVINIFDEHEKIPEADVYLLKDVMIHWRHEQIRQMIPILLEKCKYIITTNCYPINQPQTRTIGDIPMVGHFHKLYSKAEPLLSFNAKPIFYYYTKEVCLIQKPLSP